MSDNCAICQEELAPTPTGDRYGKRHTDRQHPECLEVTTRSTVLYCGESFVAYVCPACKRRFYRYMHHKPWYPA